MWGREVVERQQGLPVSDQLVDRFGILVAELGDERVDAGFGIAAGLHLLDLMQRCFRRLVEPFGEEVENVGGGLVHPTPLLPGFGEPSASAAQNPKAPSPTATTGALIPRSLRSRSTSAQDSVDSR